jgi:hypothetical protein
MKITHIGFKKGFPRAVALGVLLLACFGLAHDPDLSGKAGVAEVAAADYVEPYEGHGTIDALYDDKIVIGDSLYVLSGLVRYYSDHTRTETTGRYHFKVGTRVGFHVNREGQVEVLFIDE